MTATDKLRMLAESGVIDDVTRSAVVGLLPWLQSKLKADVDSDGVPQMMVTHLAMATARARQGEVLDPPGAPDPGVTDADRSLAAGVLHQLADVAGGGFSPSEEAHLAAYVAAVRSSR